MADTNHTPRHRFAQSKFLAKTYTSHLTEHSPPGDYTINPQLTDAGFAELMETLRQHINYVLRLPWPVQKRRRLLCNYWEVELRVKEMRLLLDPVVLDQLEAEQLKQDKIQREGLSP